MGSWCRDCRCRVPGCGRGERLIVSTRRFISSPLTDEMLRPLEVSCTHVQFSEPLEPYEYQRLARFLENYPEVALRVFDSSRFADLSFLEFFPKLAAFEADELSNLQSLAGLEHTATHLTALTIGRSGRPIRDPERLRACGRLESVVIVGMQSALQYLPEGTLTGLALGYRRSRTLRELQSFRRLGQLTLFRGSLQSLSGMRDLPLTRLQIDSVAALEDLSELSDVLSLRSLSLWRLQRVRYLPDLSHNEQLDEVELVGMRGVTDLSSLSTAPNLQRLRIAEMDHLAPADFNVLDPLRPLSQAIVGIGNETKNRIIQARLLSSRGSASEPN
jgi:hypothetical protein